MRLGTTVLSVTRPGSKRKPVAAVPIPTYALTSDSSVDEGDNMTVTVTTTNVSDSTVLYWSTSNITTSDPDFTATTGTTTITNNSGSFSVAAVADSTTEGAETFGITLRRNNQNGPIVASTTNKTINDTSLTPSYSASSASSINEGSALGVTVTTTNVADSTTLYWTTNHTTTSAADFSSNSGSFTITSNSGTFNVPVVADLATEGAETFTVEIRTTSTSGTIVATLPSVTVNDTSVAPTYSFSSASTVTEGSTLACTVTTTGVSNGTTLYWTINHTTTASADFTSTSGSFTVNSNSGTFSISAEEDTDNESDETFTVEIRTGSTSGTVVETSSTITLNNYTGFEDISDYSHVRFDKINVGSGKTVHGIAFNPTGTIMWTIDQGASTIKRIRQQSLSTAWDISTHGSATSVINLVAGSPSGFSAPREVRFKPDGTMMWVNDVFGVIREYTLSTAWDQTNMTNTAHVDFGGSDNRVNGFFWKPDGTALFLIDIVSDKIHKKELTTAWDIESTVTSSTSSIALDLSTTADEAIGMSIFFSPDGLKLYFTGQTTDKVHMYNLSTAWDITSSSFSGAPDDYLDISSQETAPQVITFSDDGKHLYVGGAQGDGVDQYTRP